VKRARPVEVVDVFEIRVWRSRGIRPESSGFVSTTAHPLVDRGRVIGSISFCFTDRQHFEDRTRTLLVTAARVVAEAAVAARKEP
jgi:GAF domain-containing protein